jgi:hypothetical protein
MQSVIDRQKKHVPYAVAGAGETAFTFASGYAAGVTLTTAVGGGGTGYGSFRRDVASATNALTR